MQPARPPHLLQILLQPHQPLIDQPPVGLDLRLARPAQKTEATALPLKVGRRPHQTRPLIRQMRQFDLQDAFPGRRPLPENIEDQRRPVDYLAAPLALQVALLHRRQRGIDDDDVDTLVLDDRVEVLHVPATQKRRRLALAQRQDRLMHHDEPDRGGQTDSLLQPRLGGARGLGSATLPFRRSFPGPFPRQNDSGPCRSRAVRHRTVRTRMTRHGLF